MPRIFPSLRPRRRNAKVHPAPEEDKAAPAPNNATSTNTEEHYHDPHPERRMG
jgi:hypothetical protein